MTFDKHLEAAAEPLSTQSQDRHRGRTSVSNEMFVCCRATRYNCCYDLRQEMIKSIKHKGLKQLYHKGITKGVRTDHVDRLRTRLAVLDAATSTEDIGVHNWKLHALGGDKSGQWSISVSGNWRLFFEFIDGNVYLLDYDDYH